MVDMRYVYVNIYNENVIPMINRRGPVFSMGMRYKLYEMLKEIPGVEIYTVEEDKKLRAQGITPGSQQKKSQQASTAAETKQPSQPTPQVKVEDLSAIDSAIEEKIKSDQTNYDEDIKLSDTDIEEIKEHTISKVYTLRELQGMSKSKLKHILNVERKNKPGTKYYGAFHDRKPKLIEYVLASQDSTDQTGS
jgi:DNA-binding transcriptional regulator YiaG